MDGAKLRALRKRLGYSDAALFCVQFGFPTSTLQYWEESKREPKISNFALLAESFGFSLDDLATELGVIARPRRTDALPPDLAAALRRALSDGVHPDTILQGIELAIVAHRGRDAASEQAATADNRPPKRGRAAL